MSTFLTLLLFCLSLERHKVTEHKLLDGFRWDYFDSVELPGFKKLFKNGVKAEYMTVDFPSLSLPNYYSVLTGKSKL